MNQTTRRSFLAQSAAAFPLIVTSRVNARVFGANERLHIAVAGVNGRGRSHIGGWSGQKDVEITWLIDPDQKVLASRLKEQEKKAAEKGNAFVIKGTADVRKALEDKELDAISIATPNHWHSLMTIWAAQHGKHVYVEKPMSHDIVEGRIAVEAQKKYGVVVQHGTQQRSEARVAGLTAAIHDGKFGKMKFSYGYCCKPRNGIGHKAPSSPPEQLDWNLWRGPAKVDYHANLVHYNWHWFWPTGNGDMNNQGTHQLDVARWAIDKDQTHPVRVMALGGRFKYNDQGETPNTMFAIAEYPNGQQCLFNVRNVGYEGYQRQVENQYYFEDGSKIIGGKRYAKGAWPAPRKAKSKKRGEFWVSFDGRPLEGDHSEAKDLGEKISHDQGAVTPGGNWGSFIAACRAGKPEMANGNALDAHYGCVLGHLMNNSYRLGKQVPFNKKAMAFGDNADAAEHFGRLHDIMEQGAGVPVDGAQYTVGPWLTYNPESERHTGAHAEAANALLQDANHEGFKLPTVKDV